MVAVRVGQPDVQEVHVLMVLRVAGHVFGDPAPSLRVGKADVRVQRHAAVQLAPPVDFRHEGAQLFGKLRALGRPPALTAVQTQRLGRPAVPHVVKAQPAAGDFRFALPLPLLHRAHGNRLRRAARVQRMGIVGIVIIERNVKFQHVAVQSQLRRKIDGFQHGTLAFRAFVALSAIAVIRRAAI